MRKTTVDGNYLNKIAGKFGKRQTFGDLNYGTKVLKEKPQALSLKL